MLLVLRAARDPAGHAALEEHASSASTSRAASSSSTRASRRRRCRRSRRRRSTTRSRRCASASTRSASSEPEIQRAGANQISVGLPDVKNAERARGAGRQRPRSSSSTTGSRTSSPTARSTRAAKALFQAVAGGLDAEAARPRQTDVPPGSRPDARAEADTSERHRQATGTTCSAPTSCRSARTRSRCAPATTSRRGPARSCWPTTTAAPAAGAQVRQGHRVPRRARGARLGRAAGRLAA